MLIWLPLILIAVCCALYVDWGEVMGEHVDPPPSRGSVPALYSAAPTAAQPAVTARPDDGAEGLATPPGQRPSAPRTDAER